MRFNLMQEFDVRRNKWIKLLKDFLERILFVTLIDAHYNKLKRDTKEIDY